MALADPTTTCYQYFAKLIQIRQDSAKALAAAAQSSDDIPTLSSMYGVSPINFDTATLYLANQA
jgi:hypothetical protein